MNSNITINKIYLELTIPSIFCSRTVSCSKAINENSSNNIAKGNAENKANFNSNINSLMKEAKFDINNNVYFSNLTSLSKISPFKADQGMKPYFYVKTPIDKKPYNSNGKNKTNEISIYDMISPKESNSSKKNGNGQFSKKDFDRNSNSERLGGFIRKKVNPEQLNKEKNSISLTKGTNRPNYLNLFSNFFENLSNMHIVLRNITPFIDLKNEELLVLFYFNY